MFSVFSSESNYPGAGPAPQKEAPTDKPHLLLASNLPKEIPDPCEP